MEPSLESPAEGWSVLRRLSRRLLSLGENRLELLAVEVREGREQLFSDLLLALSVAGFIFLALLAGSAALLVRVWDSSPSIGLLILMGAHGAIGAGLLFRLRRRLRDWQALPDSLDQLRKDRQCADRHLST
jgi:uncharacterized membrane protein YqjE